MKYSSLFLLINVKKALTSIAASAGEVVEFPEWTIHNMQDMNPTICANAEINTTGQLTDLRDGKQYWVSKLADGNCWMTQNLDFDIPSTVSSNSTNVEGTIQTDTVKVSTPAEWNSTDPKYNAYYDPGEYYYNGPNNTHAQGTSCNSTIGLSECAEKYPGEWSTTGDSHYHVGNYYSWSAATVKSGDGLTDADAQSSICPTGWNLPKGRVTDDAVTGSFYDLISRYLTPWLDNPNRFDLTNGNYAIYKTPLYFTYGGAVYSGAAMAVSLNGFYWTSTTSTDAMRAGTHYLVLAADFVSPSAYNPYRYWGRSVRCVAAR